MKAFFCGLVFLFSATFLFAQSGCALEDFWEVYELAVKTTGVDQNSGMSAKLCGGSGRSLLVVNTKGCDAVLIGLESQLRAIKAQVKTVCFPSVMLKQGVMGVASAERNVFSLRLEADGFGESLLLGTETVLRRTGKGGEPFRKRTVSLRGVGIDYDPEKPLDPDHKYSVNTARYNQLVSDRMNRSDDPFQPLYEYIAEKTGRTNDIEKAGVLIGPVFDATEKPGGDSGGSTEPIPLGGTLAGTKWLLTAWLDGSVVPVQFAITADFDASQIGGRSAVNYYGGSYTAAAEGRFTTGDLRSTLMGGSEEAMRAESLYFVLLKQARMYAATATTLTLKDGNNQDLLIFTSRENKPNPGNVLNITGTVVWKPLEGGFFAIDADDGKGYEPVNLPREYRISGRRVRITAVERNDMASKNMYGRIIEIITISEKE